ncbi:hypothetical protein [Spiroplasma endosymbiont of Amphimallon solstitiale]|uniref:hypothetical protein n=1 Tax=Spiroplasma endosymbiont of Amphimallon solstitiale TaxID=3066288 RepID=UPI00313B89A3
MAIKLPVDLSFFVTNNFNDPLFNNFWIPKIVLTLSLELSFNYVEKYGWPKIIHQFTLKILFLIKNLLKVTLFSVKIL